MVCVGLGSGSTSWARRCAGVAGCGSWFESLPTVIYFFCFFCYAAWGVQGAYVGYLPLIRESTSMVSSRVNVWTWLWFSWPVTRRPLVAPVAAKKMQHFPASVVCSRNEPGFGISIVFIFHFIVKTGSF